MILSRKIRLNVVGNKEEINRVYNYLRDGIYNQNLAMNQYISALYTTTMQDISKEDRQELNRLYSRISTNKKGSAYSAGIQFPKGLPTTASLKQKVQQDFSNACKKGLLYGKISLPTYKKDNPLLIHVDYVRLRKTNPHLDNGMYHNYASDEEFFEHLYKPDLEVFIKFANKITFKLNLGNNMKKSAALRSEIGKIFTSEYEVHGSSIQIDGTKITLNLAIEIPDKTFELDENVTVGVDVGMAVPATCAVNNNQYRQKYIGSAEELLCKRTQIQSQRRRLQTALQHTKGGHGRNQKLKALDRLKDHERNYVKTYNHTVSKQVVDFAIQNKAKYINLEDLSGFSQNDRSSFVLRNWSYFELQNQIAYKAKMCGIEVRKIKPYMTSQTCSCCGNLEEGQRLDQAHFKCKKCGAELNADFNAARNIAMSQAFVTN